MSALAWDRARAVCSARPVRVGSEWATWPSELLARRATAAGSSGGRPHVLHALAPHQQQVARRAAERRLVDPSAELHLEVRGVLSEVACRAVEDLLEEPRHLFRAHLPVCRRRGALALHGGHEARRQEARDPPVLRLRRQARGARSCSKPLEVPLDARCAVLENQPLVEDHPPHLVRICLRHGAHDLDAVRRVDSGRESGGWSGEAEAARPRAGRTAAMRPTAGASGATPGARPTGASPSSKLPRLSPRTGARLLDPSHPPATGRPQGGQRAAWHWKHWPPKGAE